MSKQRTKARQKLIMLLVVFALPIVIAKVALEQKWFNYGVTNQGQLPSQQLNLHDIGLSDLMADEHWLLVYLMPNDCLIPCQNMLSGLQNTYRALGREMPRVNKVALMSQQQNLQALEQFQNQDWHFTERKQARGQGQVWVVDPLGNLVLTYPQAKSNGDFPALGKAIVSDMKKLLKYSRIG